MDVTKTPILNLELEIKETAAPLKRGSLCPKCGQARLDYNGILDLECPACGYQASGGGGCT